MAWTAKELDVLRTMWTQPSIPVTEISKRLGRSKGSVIGAAHRHLHVTRTGDAIKGEKAEPEPIAKGMAPIVAPTRRVRHPNIFEARDGQCRWPMWEGGEHIDDKRYCGAPGAGQPCLCEEHHAVSYRGSR